MNTFFPTQFSDPVFSFIGYAKLIRHFKILQIVRSKWLKSLCVHSAIAGCRLKSQKVLIFYHCFLLIINHFVQYSYWRSCTNSDTSWVFRENTHRCQSPWQLLLTHKCIISEWSERDTIRGNSIENRGYLFIFMFGHTYVIFVLWHGYTPYATAFTWKFIVHLVINVFHCMH